MNAASSTTLGEVLPTQHRRDRRIDMTHGDVQALRAEVRNAAFLHWPRVAQMFGITVGHARELAGKSEAQRLGARRKQ
jgi:hypothetical protein